MTTTTTTIHEAMQNCTTKDQKKQLLKSISIDAKEQIQLGATEEETVNGVLISWLTNKTHQEFNGFWQWKKLGYKVKKGEKAFFIWSKKRKAKDKDSQEDDKEYSFFSLAYLFSNAQVEPLKKEDA
ncbi:ArdC-like ssDNA-binding domain-containing protein [Lacinutrix iliipiscaria]|uniref:ArdC-like ssDNA-binding domain-containing protein n=1 Tax=Lacinutrix iliipiscaria TaxID=1230532 RepID=A0ABW5WPU7_9FLAO